MSSSDVCLAVYMPASTPTYMPPPRHTCRHVRSLILGLWSTALQLAKSSSREPELRNEITLLKQQLQSLEDTQQQATRVIETKQRALDAATAELKDLRSTGTIFHHSFVRVWPLSFQGHWLLILEFARHLVSVRFLVYVYHVLTGFVYMCSSQQ